MLVSEFCKKYGMAHQSVYEKIHRHENDVLSGHIKRLPKQFIVLDDFAVDYLAPKLKLAEEYRNRVSTLTAENNDLKYRLSVYDREMQKSISEINALNDDRINSLTRENAKQLNLVRAEHDKKAAALARKYDDRINDLKSEYEKRISTMTVEKSEIEKTVSALREKTTELQMFLSEKSGRISELEELLKSTNDRIISLKSENTGLTQELNTYLNENEQKSIIPNLFRLKK